METTQADLVIARSDIRYHPLSSSAENGETAEWELQQTAFELEAVNLELIATKLELRRCRLLIRDNTPTTSSTTNNERDGL